MAEGGIEYLPSQPRAISIADFKSIRPQPPMPYTPGGSVTRENFIRFYIESFKTSQGKAQVQQGVFDWYLVNRNFDAMETLRHFYAAGGGKCLSPEEIQVFSSRYRPIKKHTDNEGKIESTSEEIASLITIDLETKVHGDIQPFIPRERLRNMPWETFAREAANYVDRVRKQ